MQHDSWLRLLSDSDHADVQQQCFSSRALTFAALCYDFRHNSRRRNFRAKPVSRQDTYEQTPRQNDWASLNT